MSLTLNIDKLSVPKVSRNGRIYNNGATVTRSSSVASSPGSVQVQTDWNAIAGMAMILNKPDLSLWYLKTEINQPAINLTGKDITSDTLASKTFTPAVNAIGAGGYGFKVWDTSGKFTLEIDNLRVRNNLSAAELIINRIRASNGSIWVSDGAKVKDGMIDNSTNGLLVLEDSQVFTANDIVKAQSWSTSGAYAYVYKVVGTGNNAAGNYITIVNLDGSKPTIIDLKGKEFVRVGNTSDSTRQGSLYMTSSDTNSPYFEVLDGMTNGTIADSNRKVRLGKLDGVTMTDGTVLTGYGLYTKNGWFEGTVKATKLYTSKTGQRIEIDGPNNRFMFYSDSNPYYLKIDANGGNNPYINIISGLGGDSWIDAQTCSIHHSSGSQFRTTAMVGGYLDLMFKGLPLWSTIQPNPDYWAVVRVNRVTGQISYSD